MLNYIGVGERTGSGVPDIYKIWAKENYQDPIVNEIGGRENTIHTIVTLPLITKNQDFLPKSPEKSPKNFEIEERKKAVIALISSDNSVSRSSMAKVLGITDRQVRTVLDQLKEEGIICFEGVGKGGHWIVAEN